MWKDPETWLASLKADLEIVGKGYLRMPLEEPGAEARRHWPSQRANRTTFAAMTISRISDALRELPGMADHVGLAPLHDLVAALLDLGDGGQPPLLQPTKGVGKGTELAGQRIVRQYAVAFVGLLERCGTKPTPASKEIAEMLAKAGHRGLKDGPLSGETVKGWWNKTRQRGFEERDPRGAAAYRRFFEHVEKHPQWPFSAAMARTFIASIIASPLMQSKVGHPLTSPT